jgi:hypothetical protein
LSLAGVILAHNITALTAAAMAICIPLFVHRSLRAAVPACLGVLAAFSLTAFFWVPALALKPLIQSETLLTGRFDFHTQFPLISTIFWPRAFYSGGWLSGLAFLAIFLLPINDPQARRLARAFGIAAAVCLFLMLRASAPLWDILPLIRYMQFPWRFIGPLGVTAAVGCGIAIRRPGRRIPVWCLELAVLAAALLNAWPALHEYHSLAPKLSERIEQILTPEAIRSNHLRTTVTDEYLPRGADLSAVHREDGCVLFHQWAFPVWSATVNGVAVPVARGPGGVAAVKWQPAAQHVDLTLVEPAIRQTAKAFSGMAAIILLGIAIMRWLRQRRALLTD